MSVGVFQTYHYSTVVVHHLHVAVEYVPTVGFCLEEPPSLQPESWLYHQREEDLKQRGHRSSPVHHAEDIAALHHPPSVRSTFRKLF